MTVCERFRAAVTKGEKVAIIGRTGVGKTTLCKLLTGELRPDAGSIEWGTQTSVGYLAQDHRDGIDRGYQPDELAACLRSRGEPAGHPGLARSDAVQG